MISEQCNMVSHQDLDLQAFLNKYIIGSTFAVGSISRIKCAKARSTITPTYPERSNAHYAMKITDLGKLPECSIQMEPEILAATDHENIVKLFDCYLGRDHMYLVLEYIPGRNLYYYIENSIKFPREEIAKILDDLCSALAYLHSGLIVHRDINPENLMLELDDSLKVRTLKVIDFGTATYVTLLESSYGSNIQFCAPELRFTQEYGCNVDVFSAGVVLCYLIFGLEISDFDFSMHDIVDSELDCPCIPEWYYNAPFLYQLMRGMLDVNKHTRMRAVDVVNNIWIKIYCNRLDFDYTPPTDEEI